MRTPHAEQRGVDVAVTIAAAIDRDVIASEKNVFHTHQKAGELDVYFLYNVESERRELTFTLRGARRTGDLGLLERRGVALSPLLLHG